VEPSLKLLDLPECTELIAPLQRFLWSINFAVRAIMSKVLPAFFSPHSFMLVQVRQTCFCAPNVFASSSLT